MKKTAYLVLGQVCILGAWQLLAHSGAAGLTVPTPANVIRVYLQPRFAALLYRSAMATVSSAAAGLVAGALLGSATAMVSYLLPPLRPGRLLPLSSRPRGTAGVSSAISPLVARAIVVRWFGHTALL